MNPLLLFSSYKRDCTSKIYLKLDKSNQYLEIKNLVLEHTKHDHTEVKIIQK